MALTLSEIRTQVQAAIHNDSTATNALIQSWVNLAQDDVEQQFLGRYLIQAGNILTETDIGEYVIVVDDFRSFGQFWQTDIPIRMRGVTYDEYRQAVPDDSLAASGSPRLWLFTGFTSGFPTVRFWPIPDTDGVIVNFEYFANLADLDNDNDVSLISELGWDDLLITGCVTRYHAVHSSEDFVRWQSRYRELMTRFRTDFNPTKLRRRQMRDAVNYPRTAPVLRLPDNYPQE